MLSGANMIYGCGMLETGETGDFGALVADNALVGMIKHLFKGVRVTEEDLALDVIRRVGPRGNFLGDIHTFEHLRENSIGSNMIDRRKRDHWEKDGSKDLYTRATEEALDILNTHKPEPLPESIQATLKEIIAECEAEQTKKF